MQSILCRVGRHDWAVRSTGDGERYRECRRCGSIERDALPPGFSATAIGPPGG